MKKQAKSTPGTLSILFLLISVPFLFFACDSTTITDADLIEKLHENVTENSHSESNVFFNNSGTAPLYVVNGEIITDAEIKNLDPAQISKIVVLKGEKAEEQYHEKGKYGVIKITLKTNDHENKFKLNLTDSQNR